jgi:hypothetical protein
VIIVLRVLHVAFLKICIISSGILRDRFGGFMSTYADKLKDSLYWWLGRKRPFIINNEYKLELLFIDKVNNSAKIRVTNIKSGETVEQEASHEQC